MDEISGLILGKLESRGFDSVDTLPNIRDTDDWKDIQEICKMSTPEMMQLKNALFKGFFIF